MAYNHKHQPMIYKVKDHMWLSIRNLNQQRSSKKLSDKYVNPYTMLSLIGRQTYQLNLRNNIKHDIFYVSLLKSVKRHPWKPLKPILMKSKREWLVNFIVNKHVCEKKCIIQYQVQWKEYGSHKNIWESLKHLENAKDHVTTYESWFRGRADV